MLKEAGINCTDTRLARTKTEAVAASRGEKTAGDLNESFMIGPVDVDPSDPYYTRPEAGKHFHPNLWPAAPDGLRETYTLLYPEAMILDSDLYDFARYALADMELSPETLAVDVVGKVGPGGHFLAQKHTRTHMRSALVRSVSLTACITARPWNSWIAVLTTNLARASTSR